MKKLFYIVALLGVITKAIFAQEVNSDTAAAQDEKIYRHQQFDMLIGINAGFGGMMTGGILDGKKGTLALSFDIGLNYDFYVLDWFSVNTGLLLHPEGHLVLDKDIAEIDHKDFNLVNYAATPLCLTIPIAVHVNVPGTDWLYTGLGVNINIPVISLLNSAIDTDIKGGVFVSMPIDFGFDLIKPGKGGMRFFMRITPTFVEHGTTVPIGFIWQIYNWKI
ncbi:MAG: hypothetical protein LBU17_10925 [Treponema sp.]|nr:hypothetical protein [Treponema sp.]